MSSRYSFKRKAAIFLVTYLAIFSFGFAVSRELYLSEAVVTGGGLSELKSDGEFSSSANIVAVAEGDGEGILGRVHVELVPGDGDVLLNIRPFVEPDTQYSARVAIEVAKQFTHTDTSNKDVVVTFEISEDVGLVGGPSAGAATAIAVIAAIENRTINESVAMTGTVDNSGNIGEVGGILAKVKAADAVGVDLFLIPEGEMIVVTYERIEEKSSIPFLKNVRYIPKIVNVQEYIRENGLSIRVREVATVEEAAQLMIT